MFPSEKNYVPIVTCSSFHSDHSADITNFSTFSHSLQAGSIQVSLQVIRITESLATHRCLVSEMDPSRANLGDSEPHVTTGRQIPPRKRWNFLICMST
jgi:hypothetical protein